jgi:hypothetical protein
MIPEQYQGLGMPNFASISLALKLSYLQCNWGFSASHSNALMVGYDTFIIEVGLYGDTVCVDSLTGGERLCHDWVSTQRPVLSPHLKAALNKIKVLPHFK